MICCLSCWCIVENITVEYYQYIYIYTYIITHRHTHDTNNIDKEATTMIVERINVLVMKILNTEDFIKTYVKTKVRESDTTNIYSVCNIHGLFENIIKYLNVKSILNLKESCLIKQLTIQNNGDIHFISSIERLIENGSRSA